MFWEATMKREKFMKKFFKRNKVKKMVDRFDEYVKSDLIEATQRGKILLGIDPDNIFAHPSLVYSMPAIVNKKIRSTLVYGKDRVRFDLSHFNALYFDEETLYYYQTYIDHKISGGFNDVAIELPYREIKALETSLKFVKIGGVPHNLFELKFKLNNLDDIVVPLKVMAFDHKTPNEDYLIDKDLLDVVTKLKQFLRTKLA